MGGVLRRRPPTILPAGALGLLLLLVSIGSVWASEPEWNVARVGGPRLAAGTVIAVVDTGVDATHPALAGRVVEQVDYVGDGRTGDPEGHGTHVAGIAAGADAGCGAIGVAPDARVRSYRVIGADGSGDSADLFEAIRDAADAGAAVINLSLGVEFTFRSTSNGSLREALDYAWSRGSVPVIAAGNEALLGGIFGSGYSDMKAMVVTATDNRDQSPSYATPVGSADWGIAAPGGDGSGTAGSDVKSAYPDLRCAFAAGTSQAAPHVAGAVAVLLANGYSQQGAVDRLLSTARDLGSESTFGAGLLDLTAALGSSPTTTALPPTTRPTTTSGPGPDGSTPTSGGGPSVSSSPPSTTEIGAPGPSAPAAAGETTTTGRHRPPSTPSTRAIEDPDQGASGELVVSDDDSGPPTAVVIGAIGVAIGVVAVSTLRLRRTRPPEFPQQLP